jgi:hypothetical protein
MDQMLEKLLLANIKGTFETRKTTKKFIKLETHSGAGTTDQ